MVEERSVCGEGVGVTHAGADGSENVGMSSTKTGANPVHRKPKVSYGRFIRVGLVGPKPRANAVGDGQLVSIPAPPVRRFKVKG